MPDIGLGVCGGFEATTLWWRLLRTTSHLGQTIGALLGSCALVPRTLSGDLGMSCRVFMATSFCNLGFVASLELPLCLRAPESPTVVPHVRPKLSVGPSWLPHFRRPDDRLLDRLRFFAAAQTPRDTRCNSASQRHCSNRRAPPEAKIAIAAASGVERRGVKWHRHTLRLRCRPRDRDRTAAHDARQGQSQQPGGVDIVSARLP